MVNVRALPEGISTSSKSVSRGIVPVIGDARSEAVTFKPIAVILAALSFGLAEAIAPPGLRETPLGSSRETLALDVIADGASAVIPPHAKKAKESRTEIREPLNVSTPIP